MNVFLDNLFIRVRFGPLVRIAAAAHKTAGPVINIRNSFHILNIRLTDFHHASLFLRRCCRMSII